MKRGQRHRPGHVGHVLQRGADMLEVSDIVFAFDRKGGNLILIDQRGGHIILRGKRIGGSEDNVRAAFLQGDHQVCSFGGHMQTSRKGAVP